MGHDDHRHAGFCQVTHQVKHFVHHFRVKCGSRFVKQHDLRFHGKGSDDCNTLLLPAGKHIGIFIRFIGKPDAGEKLFTLFLRFRLCLQLQMDGCKHNVLHHCFMREQVKMLKNHSHLPAVEINVHVFIREIHTVKIDMTGGWDFEHIQAAKQCALARS